MDLPSVTALVDHAARTLDATARGLGRSFAAHEPGDLRDLQRQLASIAREVSTELERRERAQDATFALGFLRALEMVASGFESTAAESARRDANLATIRSRRHWAAVLAAMQEGHDTLSAIAEAKAIDTSILSKVIAAMIDANLLARRALEENEDPRRRPIELTVAGRDACERLFADTHGPIEEVVEATVAGTARLFEVGRVRRSAIVEEFHRLGPLRAERAATIVTGVLAGRCLAVVDKAESLVTPVLEVNRDLHLAFDEALHAREVLGDRILSLEEADTLENVPPLVAQLRALAAQEKLFVRVSGRFTHWEVILRTFGPSQVEVLRDNVPLPPPDGKTPYRMLWENAAVLSRDQTQNGDWLRAVLSRARELNIFGDGYGALVVGNHSFKTHRPGKIATGGDVCRN